MIPFTPTYSLVGPHQFESAVQKVPQGFIDPERSYHGHRTFLSDRGTSGYSIAPSGEVKYVFSTEKGHGNHAIKHAISQGATHLNTFEGKVSDHFKGHGFETFQREKNWTPGGPDVVWMKLPHVPTPVVKSETAFRGICSVGTNSNLRDTTGAKQNTMAQVSRKEFTLGLAKALRDAVSAAEASLVETARHEAVGTSKLAKNAGCGDMAGPGPTMDKCGDILPSKMAKEGIRDTGDKMDTLFGDEPKVLHPSDKKAKPKPVKKDEMVSDVGQGELTPVPQSGCPACSSSNVHDLGPMGGQAHFLCADCSMAYSTPREENAAGESAVDDPAMTKALKDCPKCGSMKMGTKGAVDSCADCGYKSTGAPKSSTEPPSFHDQLTRKAEPTSKPKKTREVGIDGLPKEVPSQDQESKQKWKLPPINIFGKAEIAPTGTVEEKKVPKAKLPGEKAPKAIKGDGSGAKTTGPVLKKDAMPSHDPGGKAASKTMMGIGPKYPMPKVSLPGMTAPAAPTHPETTATLADLSSLRPGGAHPSVGMAINEAKQMQADMATAQPRPTPLLRKPGGDEILAARAALAGTPSQGSPAVTTEADTKADLAAGGVGFLRNLITRFKGVGNDTWANLAGAGASEAKATRAMGNRMAMSELAKAAGIGVLGARPALSDKAASLSIVANTTGSGATHQKAAAAHQAAADFHQSTGNVAVAKQHVAAAAAHTKAAAAKAPALPAMPTMKWEKPWEKKDEPSTGATKYAEKARMKKAAMGTGKPAMPAAPKAPGTSMGKTSVDDANKDMKTARSIASNPTSGVKPALPSMKGFQSVVSNPTSIPRLPGIKAGPARPAAAPPSAKKP